MRPVLPSIAGLFCLAAVEAAASQDFIVCTITRTYNVETKRTDPTTGSDTFVILTNEDGSKTYTLPHTCVPETVFSRITETSMFFSCDQQIGDATMTRFFDLNRLTGEYQAGFAPKGRNGLIHTGTCAKSKPQF